MLLKTTNDCKLFVEKERCIVPSDLTCITIHREMWSGDKLITESSDKMFLTDEEIKTLKDFL
jgi:hypothetical protein